jgi:hypothetical protein
LPRIGVGHAAGTRVSLGRHDILANSWYANQVSKRALIESDGLSLRDAHALELFKNEGLAPDAAQRVARFFKRAKPRP